MDNIYIDTRYGFSWTKGPNEVLKGHLKQLLKGSKRTYIEVHRDLLAEIAELLDATPAAAAKVSDEQINELRQQYGVTSNGRGIKEFTQVFAFARTILALRTADHAERK